ncbi:MAG: hypothetical protein K2K77_02305 [Duncaniella sp.]|nr:hypothetical protein [Duncaniella sp.]
MREFSPRASRCRLPSAARHALVAGLTPYRLFEAEVAPDVMMVKFCGICARGGAIIILPLRG